MEHEDPKAMMKALEHVLENLHGSPSEDTSNMRIDLHEKLIARSMMLAVAGIIASFFMSIQAMFLILRITGDIQWSWWTIFVPTALFAMTWYWLNWVRKQKAQRMIDEMQRGINEIKGAFTRAEDDSEVKDVLKQVFSDLQGGPKKDSV